MTSRRLLLSLAHPDDESFGSGGLIARYVASGAEVSLICATNGDVGTVKPEMLNGYNSISELRLAELACASAKLGFKHVVRFGYRDSGMMGSETSQHPASLWQAPQEAVTRRVVEVIRDLKPQVVLTFNRYGGYGHPDHIAIQRATVAAFRLAGDPEYKTDGQQPYQPQKLYYTRIPTLMLRMGLWLLRLRREDPRQLGKNKDIDLLKILDNVEPAHARVDIRAYYDAWQEANACHASQLGGGTNQMPLWVRRRLSGSQSFTRVYPEPEYNRVDENDLFQGVRVD
ncbi:MAG: PIG-L family deacetylase [Anaerolineaceae bacterium]|nr:PIG-L family deacetylase [Anaerolineaceae bacterium]